MVDAIDCQLGHAAMSPAQCPTFDFELSNGQNSAQELVGKHCSIPVTDEQSPAICVIPLEIARRCLRRKTLRIDAEINERMHEGNRGRERDYDHDRSFEVECAHKR